jgi:hypothetical protein
MWSWKASRFAKLGFLFHCPTSALVTTRRCYCVTRFCYRFGAVPVRSALSGRSL